MRIFANSCKLTFMNARIALAALAVVGFFANTAQAQLQSQVERAQQVQLNTFAATKGEGENTCRSNETCRTNA